MKLGRLLGKLSFLILQGRADTEIKAVAFRESEVKEGTLFVCWPGASSRKDFSLSRIIEKGAAAVLFEEGFVRDRGGVQAPDYVTLVQVKDVLFAAAFVSAAWFDHPAEQMITIGITGTKGKTTTTYMVKSILENAGYKVGLIGTIEVITGKETYPAGLTTPPPYTLQSYLREMADAGCEVVVMEVSSHALMTHRTQGFIFDYGIFTNLAPDHIGPGGHSDFDHYLQCKSLLFRQCRTGIANCDDAYYEKVTEGHTCAMETYGLSERADLWAEDINLVGGQGHYGVSCRIRGRMDLSVEIAMPGRFSVYNALAAVSVCSHFHISAHDIIRALKNIRVKGRSEIVDVSGPFTFMIDYAHNVLSLENLLTSLRAYQPRRLVCLFGCGGDDPYTQQRAYMGEVSGRLADFTIITSDNPKSEDPQSIMDEIRLGMEKTDGRFIEITDRREAIAYAVQHAMPGDIVVLAGKGHEVYQEIWGIKFPMDERALVLEASMRMKNTNGSVMSDCRTSGREGFFHPTAVHFPFVPVHEQIHRQAVKHPDRTAVICAGKSMSYGELDRQSDAIAMALIRKNVVRDELVAVLFEREATAYAAEIAILKSGAGFMPFVPEFPDDRINYCMKNSGSRLLLTTGTLKAARQFQETAYEVLTVEELLENRQAADRDIALPQVSENDLAYCIYTSGTMGRPKGVLIEHRNIANYVNGNEKSIEVMHLAAPGRISLALAAFSFDFSLEEELVPLCHGNTVVIATSGQIHDPVQFADLVLSTGASAMSCTPTYLSGLISARESRNALRQIKLFHVGAEAFPEQLYAQLRALREDSVIMNVYGPTECTIISAVSVVRGDREITVGKPRANTQCFILDDSGHELPAGQKGELIICGSQVGRGYIGQDGADGAFFSYRGLPAYRTGDLAVWTNAGEIRILGRLDNQVKLRGYRIELSEVEAVMREYPAVQSAAAALKRKDGAAYLAGYYTAAETLDSLLLKRHMRTKLPDYMIPAVFMRIGALPLSLNGKIDREALPEPNLDERKAQYISPESGLEKKLCRAMEKVLNRAEHSVGLMDDFFDLGGDSISAMELLAEADIAGLEYADIFNFRTPAEILGELKRREIEPQDADIDRIDRDARLSSHMLTPVQRELIDVQRIVPEGATVSSIRFLMRMGCTVDAERFCQALNKVLAHHPGFAMKIVPDAEHNLVQVYDPSMIPKVKIHALLPAEEDALADTLIRPFDELLDHSLCRVQLFRGRRGLYFFMDVHHTLADGYSQRPLFRNIVDAYYGRALKRDRYPALLAMEEQSALEGQYEADRMYLLRRYAGYDWCIMPLAKDPACEERGGTYCRHLRFNAGQLKDAAERLSVSFSVMHLASILLAMHRVSGRRDVMTFWTFHNRPTKAAEDAVGMLMKTLPVGCHMNEMGSLKELLLAVREQVVSGIAHSAYSYLVEQVFSRGIVWIESNHQIHMDDSELDVFEPEYIELHNAYADTADNVMLAIISENAHEKDTFDFVLDHGGKGIRAADVERLHREIYEILEAIVLDEGIRLHAEKPERL